MVIIKLILLAIIIALPVILGGVSYFIPDKKLHQNSILWKILFRFHKHFPYMFLVFLVLLTAFVESKIIDIPLTKWTKLDFTPAVYAIEGNIVEILQKWMLNPVFTAYFAFVYQYMFFFILYFSILLYVLVDNRNLVQMISLSYFFNYIIALPFYLFFPINEIWLTNLAYSPVYGYTNVIGLLHENNPSSEELLYAVSTINNTFPSLHTSILFSIMLITIINIHQFFSIFSSLMFFSIILSAIYLGIHWIIDILAGVAFAIIVVYLVKNLEFELVFPFKIKSIKWKNK